MAFGSPGRRIPMLTPTCSKRELAVEHREEAHLSLEPPEVACVDDEPAFAGDAHATLAPLERGFGNHRL
jgi:hypothetical protein